MEIKKADIEDCVRCVELLSETEIGKTYYPHKKIMEIKIKEAIQSDDFFVAVSENEIAGFIWFKRKGAFAMYPYLHTIVVDKEWQGRGIGSKLLDFYEQYAIEKEKMISSKSYLLVADFNNDAYNFYQNKGYKQVGNLQDLFRKQVQERLMEKSIVKEGL